MILKSTLNANNKNISLGSQKTGNGRLTVDGSGAKVTNIDELSVGKSGAGTVLIENLGSVDASFLDDSSDILAGTGGMGKITVSDGTLHVTKRARIGAFASGSLTVENKGIVSVGGDLTVYSQGSVAVSSDAEIGVNSSAVKFGFVTIGQGGSVGLDCASGAYNANTLINGGRLEIEQSDAIAKTKGISFGAGGGTLHLTIGVT